MNNNKLRVHAFWVFLCDGLFYSFPMCATPRTTVGTDAIGKSSKESHPGEQGVHSCFEAFAWGSVDVGRAATSKR